MNKKLAILFMNLSLISPAEKELLRKIELSNDADVSLWRISNIIIPIATIIISIVCSIIFKLKTPFVLITYLNLLLNGAIPMIALNRISGMGVYLFRYDRSKEKGYGLGDTVILRTKLFTWFLFLLIGTVILYIYQVLNYPFSLGWSLLFIFLFSIYSVYSSIKVSKKVYLLQDKLIDKTFDQEIRDDMKQKGHGENW